LVLGVCQLVFRLPENFSLKGKRSQVKSLLDRIRHRFNAAAAEVANLDNHHQATLAMVVVSNDSSHVNRMVDQIVSYAESNTEMPLVDRNTQILNLGVSLS
jgi:uncharacterized protein YlxP (DUF503 family)